MATPDPISSFRSVEASLFGRFGLHPRERVVTLRDPALEARFLDQGEGPPLLHVHGGGACGAFWAPLAAAIRGRRHVMPDRPGFVLTPAVDLRGVNFRQHAVGFLSSFLDALELEAADIVANSMGGLWSLWLAIDRPERVRTLTLLGAPALTAGSSAPLPMRLLGRPWIGRALMAFEPPSPRQVHTTWRRMGHDPQTMEPLIHELLLATERMPGYSSAWRGLMARVFRFSGVVRDCALDADELERLRCPVGYAWGDRDPFGDLELARRTAAATAGATLVGVRGGHLPWLDDAPACAAVVVRTCARGADAAASTFVA